MKVKDALEFVVRIAFHFWLLCRASSWARREIHTRPSGLIASLDRFIQPEARCLRLGFWFRLKQALF